MKSRWRRRRNDRNTRLGKFLTSSLTAESHTRGGDKRLHSQWTVMLMLLDSTVLMAPGTKKLTSQEKRVSLSSLTTLYSSVLCTEYKPLDRITRVNMFISGKTTAKTTWEGFSGSQNTRAESCTFTNIYSLQSWQVQVVSCVVPQWPKLNLICVSLWTEVSVKKTKSTPC